MPIRVYLEIDDARGREEFEARINEIFRLHEEGGYTVRLASEARCFEGRPALQSHSAGSVHSMLDFPGGAS